jgi:hypothetical protein
MSAKFADLAKGATAPLFALLRKRRRIGTEKTLIQASFAETA